jgi:hypothetical protein
MRTNSEGRRTRADSEGRRTRTNSVYCLAFFNTASNKGNTGPPTVGYHVTQQEETLPPVGDPVMQQYWSGECIHGTTAATVT